VAAWPHAAGAQRAMPVIGYLDFFSAERTRRQVAAFRQGLAEVGYIEGKNVSIEYRWADGQAARLPELAADLVRRQVAVIVASGPVSSALAAKAATSTIPIVVAGGADPVKYGLVTSLHQPGGNVTGVTHISTELAGKRLDLLSEMVPRGMIFAYLSAYISPLTDDETPEVLAAARTLGRDVVVQTVRNDRDFEAAFAAFAERRADTLLVGSFGRLVNSRHRILALAARHKIPAMYPISIYVLEGGLMSYGSGVETTRLVGSHYVAQILKGVKPADLPVQRPTKFSLVLNLKTAKALGLDVPTTLLVLADQVIE
jgi:putative tryptophan/tyrosine transport system substrate-binding protein